MDLKIIKIISKLALLGFWYFRGSFLVFKYWTTFFYLLQDAVRLYFY